MQFVRLLTLAGLLLAACGAEPNRAASDAPTSIAAAPTTAPTTQPPTALPSQPPTAVPTATQPAPTATALPTATSVPTATPVPTEPPTPTPVQLGAFAISEPFDVSAQAGALLPEFAGDLNRAGEWNRYTIRGTLDTGQRLLSASQRVEYTNRDSVPLGQVYFHLYPNLSDFGGRLDVSALAVNGQPVEPVLELRRYLLRVNLPAQLAPGETTVITFDFQTRAPENASRKLYGAFNKENGVLAMASSYPILAVVRQGVWDIGRPDPKGDFVNSETALFDVTLDAPGDWKLVTTGSAIDYRSAEGRQTTRFVSGPQRDFTITALQLEEASAEVDGTRVTSYYRAGSASGRRVALDAAANAVRAFNKRFGRYPMRELDVIEINARLFLGVEYPGLTMIEHNLYVDQGSLEITVAHEVGHMWFYGTVGNNVQRESWLDEAFASYSQIVYREEVNGPAAAERELEEFRNRYRSNLAAGRDAPVSQPNERFNRNYVALVYGKAVLFIQALRERLGEEGFDRFLHSYYEQHRYAYVTGNDLVASAEQVCACELDSLYESWILKAVRVDVP